MQSPRTVKDGCGRTVIFPYPPQRVVSLCPSQTETLIDLGLGPRLVGRTKFCIHPAEVVSGIPEIGGTKKVRLEALLALQPDLVIAEKEEQTPALVAELEAHVPVYVTVVENLAQGLAGIRELGELTGTLPQAETLFQAVSSILNAQLRARQPLKVGYMIWHNPWMAAGANTYIHSMLEHLGFQNVFAGRPGRYPVLTEAEICESGADILLLSSEPFPFTATHIREMERISPDSRVLWTEGEPLTWYGTRLLRSGQTLSELMQKVFK